MSSNLGFKLLGTTQVSMLGAIFLYAGSDEPDDWMICDGRAIDRTSFSPLFSMVGTTYGVGDGMSTFNIPDLRGRCAVGSGQGSTAEGGTAGTSRSLGQKGGTETHTLTSAQMPAHTHGVTTYTTATDASLQLLGSGLRITAQNTAGVSASAGSGGAHPNMSPYAVLNYLIRVDV
jgi:microcystin-dependent protein